jgi:L-serine dehydratase
MPVSAFDLFKIGIGPSSSHTVGPMRAACLFVRALDAEGVLTATAAVHVELFGSLGATGHGHGTVKAVVAGLAGEKPDTVDPKRADHLLSATREAGRLTLLDAHPVGFDPDRDIVLHRRKRLAYHSNAMTFTAAAADGGELASRTYYSVGGGFIVDEAARTLAEGPALISDPTPVPFPFSTGAELLAHTARSGLPISGVVLANECARRPEAEVRAGLLEIWQAMRQCVDAGLTADGTLPGGLKVRRRASALRQQLTERAGPADPLDPLDWVTAYAPTPTRTGSSGSCSSRRGSAASSKRTPPSAGPRWAARPKSGSSTTSASPATRSAGWCRSLASSGTPSPRSRRSPPPGWRSAVTGSTRCPWTRRSKRCAKPAPT